MKKSNFRTGCLISIARLFPPLNIFLLPYLFLKKDDNPNENSKFKWLEKMTEEDFNNLTPKEIKKLKRHVNEIAGLNMDYNVKKKLLMLLRN